MKTPLLIGLSARIYTPGSAGVDLPGVWTKTLHYLEQSAAHWVMSGGALAVLVPPPANGPGAPCERACLADYAQALDGLVLQGGNDVAPAHYGEDPLHPDWQGDALRDQYELALIRAFVAAGKPVFGICRGLQLLNVCFGGTLLQDIGTQRPQALDHRIAHKYEDHFHSVQFVPGTHLASLYPGVAQANTNSIHHQGINTLAPGFVVEAVCPEDGMVEAVRRSGPGFVAGVQWHPEFHRTDDPATLDDSPILQDFLQAAAAVREAKALR